MDPRKDKIMLPFFRYRREGPHSQSQEIFFSASSLFGKTKLHQPFSRTKYDNIFFFMMEDRSGNPQVLPHFFRMVPKVSRRPRLQGLTRWGH